MRLLLSSWGLGTTLFHDYFYGMPPPTMGTFGPWFVPDYPILFLFDQFVVDAATLERIRDGDMRSYYQDMAAVMEALTATGRLSVEDFAGVVRPYQEEIKASVEYDLRNIDSWASAFEESILRWREFAAMGKQYLLDKQTSGWSVEEVRLLQVFEQGYYGHSSTLAENFGTVLDRWREKMDAEDRDYARHVVGQYLTYIANNLCLSDQLNAAIHDWSDLEPIYRTRLRVSLRRDEGTDAMRQVRRLFEVLYPGFEPRDVLALARALDDPRVESLRSLVNDAVAGSVEFDVEFANATLRDVLQVERELDHQRKVVGWLTLPLDFVPWAGTVLQKGVEEVAGRVLESRKRKGKEWFYLISDMVER